MENTINGDDKLKQKPRSNNLLGRKSARKERLKTLVQSNLKTGSCFIAAALILAASSLYFKQNAQNAWSTGTMIAASVTSLPGLVRISYALILIDSDKT